jgi:hypothetical protein
VLIKTEEAHQSDKQQFEIGALQADSGFTALTALVRTRRLAALGGSDAAARAADSRSSASLARRSVRKRLVLAASVCRSSAFGELGFTLLLFDCMFFGALSVTSMQHPDYSGSFVVFIASAATTCVGSRVRARFVRVSSRLCQPGSLLHKGSGQGLRRPAAPLLGLCPITDDACIGAHQFALLSPRFRHLRSGLLRLTLRVRPFLEAVRPAVSKGNAHLSAMTWSRMTWSRERYTLEQKVPYSRTGRAME